MTIIICKKCEHKNSDLMWTREQKKNATCQKCGESLSEIEKPQSIPIITTPTVIIRDIVHETKKENEFRPIGILCLRCEKINPFNNRKCETCGEKLIINPNTIVYSNNVEETIVCRKCGKYTNFKGIRCQYCDKKFKF